MKVIDEILEKHIAGGNLPCAVAGVANSDGTLYTGAAGLRSLDYSVPMTVDTIFAIASMTKLVTTVATLQLVEKELIDLDTPINAYLPGIEHLKLFSGFDAQDKPLLSTPKSIPTTRHLLTHTSGYVYEIWNGDALRHVSSGQIGSFFSQDGTGMMAPIGFSSGERWEYSIGIDWAGVIVEKLSGKSLEVYFDDHIFKPLGMEDRFYAVPEDKAFRRAAIHARGETGLEVVPHLTEPVSGGGGLSSTISDYLRFMRVLLNRGSLDGANILKPYTVDMMFENHIGDIDVTLGVTQMPAYSNDFDMGFGAPAKWGLGIFGSPN
jgi:methyl acetate hydrolase